MGEDMGDRVVVMVKRPSKGRSGRGVVTSAVMWVWMLGFVRFEVLGRGGGGEGIGTGSFLTSHRILHIHHRTLALAHGIDRMHGRLCVGFP